MESGDELENDNGQEGPDLSPNPPSAENTQAELRGPGAKDMTRPTKKFKSANPLDFCVSSGLLIIFLMPEMITV